MAVEQVALVLMVLGRLYASTARVSYAEGLYRCNHQPASCSSGLQSRRRSAVPASHQARAIHPEHGSVWSVRNRWLHGSPQQSRVRLLTRPSRNHQIYMQLLCLLP